jgi:hypothetical protein
MVSLSPLQEQIPWSLAAATLSRQGMCTSCASSHSLRACCLKEKL